MVCGIIPKFDVLEELVNNLVLYGLRQAHFFHDPPRLILGVDEGVSGIWWTMLQDVSSRL